MEWRRFGFITGLFLAFLVLFSTVSLNDTIQRGGMRVETAGAMGAHDVASGFPWQDIAVTLVLSISSTFLSVTVMDKVRSSQAEEVSLRDEDGEALLQALSNETCRDILRVLEDDELAVSEIAERLDMSLQRVQYNVDKLVDVGLVVSDKFKYSERGKEMDVYSVAKKYFVIGTE